MNFYDAHNHLHDQQFTAQFDQIIENLNILGVRGMAVNAAKEDEWQDIITLSKKSSLIFPALGIHPWYINSVSALWKERLTTVLDNHKNISIGEIGLDNNKKYNLEPQIPFFTEQLIIASAYNVPVTIHCIGAWGKLLEILSRTPLPSMGFLLHSYSGSAELLKPLAKLGAYFSCSGSFLSSSGNKQKDMLRLIPKDRLLIETDALFQKLVGQTLNYPEVIIENYKEIAKALDWEIEDLACVCEDNFVRFFGRSKA